MSCQEPDKTEHTPSADELAEFYKSLETNYRILPLFESQYNDFMLIRKYSMKTNGKLRRGWHERVMGGKKPTGTKTTPNINDYHFHDCCTKFLPSQSRANQPPPRFHLAPGPGVDKYGQRPIPDDMMQKLPKINPSPSVDRHTKKMSKKEQRAPKSTSK